MKLNLRRGNEGEVDSENVIAIIRGTEKPDEYLILTISSAQSLSSFKHGT